MVAVQTTYATRQGIALPGLVADMVTNNVITRVCETALGIGFGLIVSQGARDRGAVLGGTDPFRVMGVSVRDITLIHSDPAYLDKYMQKENMGVLSFGQIWCSPGANVLPRDPVYWNPTTGQPSNAAGAATVSPATFAGTGNGALTLASPAYGAGVKAGNYRAVVIQKVADGGVFMVFDPDGNEIGQAVVGSAFANQVRFTVADGSTDFEVNDIFTIPVAMAAVGPVPGWQWVDTALSGGIARVSVGIEK